MHSTVNLDKNVEMTRVDLPKTLKACVSAMYTLIISYRE